MPVDRSRWVHGWRANWAVQAQPDSGHVCPWLDLGGDTVLEGWHGGLARRGGTARSQDADINGPGLFLRQRAARGILLA